MHCLVQPNNYTAMTKNRITYDVKDTLLGREWNGVTNLKAFCIYKWLNYRGVMRAVNRGTLYKKRYKITIHRPE